jgi:hypothetical protein
VREAGRLRRTGADSSTLFVKPVPEGRNGIQHFIAVADEGVFVHFPLKVIFFKLFLGIERMLRFQLVMPNEEAERKICVA